MTTEGSAEPVVSVVIPTHQRRMTLAEVLEGLDQQDFPLSSFEVVVVCDGCTDGTRQMLATARYGFSLKVLELPGRGPAAARNAGIAVAAAPLVLFIDDDVVPTPTLVSQHVRAHGSATNLAVLGPMLAPERGLSPWLAAEARALRKQYEAMAAALWVPTARQFYTGNASLRREHLLRAGGFAEDFTRAEDVQLAYRLMSAGVIFRFEPAASGTHKARRPFRSWLRNAYDYGAADVCMSRSLHRASILELPAREFHARHRLTRGAVAFTLRHPRLASGLRLVGFVAVEAASTLGAARTAHGLCGAIFNSAYWAGVSDALGGPAATLRLIESQRAVAETVQSRTRAEAITVSRRLRER